jgi:hypothetical protein
MRLLVFVLILIFGLGVFQAERNNCFWHDSDRFVEWASCLLRL